MKKSQLKAIETLERKANQENLKVLKPEECLKHLSCYIDESILKLFPGDNLLSELSSQSECTYEVRHLDKPVICWERKSIEYFANAITMVVEGKHHQAVPETDMLTVLHTDQLIPLVYAYSNDDIGITLSQWALSFQSAYHSKRIHLVCVGLKKYLSKVKSKNQKALKETVWHENMVDQSKPKSNKKSKLLVVTSDAIDRAFVDLQLHTDIDIMCIENENELMMLLQQFTKSVAEAPYKKMKKGNISFVNDKSSVKV